MTEVAASPRPSLRAVAPGAPSARRSLVVASSIALLALGSVLVARPAPAASPAPVAAAASTAPARVQEAPPLWRELKPAQQSVLAPLQAEWSALDVRNKMKWVELAARFPKLSPSEQGRVQARMSEWARMTPAQRGEARLHYQQARQLGARERQERWDAYQALPPEQKQQLAERSAAATAADPARGVGPGDRKAADGTAATGASGVRSPTAGRRPIAAAIVQATPGATTTLIDRRPTPPEHQRLGTRIGGSGDEINRTTLLPRHRRADAAARPASAPSAPGPSTLLLPPPGPASAPMSSSPAASPPPGAASATPAPSSPAPVPYPLPAAIGR